ncbi:hypothetical protein Hanom_Chr16g01432881 [Helianthus anomalus]
MLQGSLDVELLKAVQSLEQNMMGSSRPREHRGTQVVFKLLFESLRFSSFN